MTPEELQNLVRRAAVEGFGIRVTAPGIGGSHPALARFREYGDRLECWLAPLDSPDARHPLHGGPKHRKTPKQAAQWLGSMYPIGGKE